MLQVWSESFRYLILEDNLSRDLLYQMSNIEYPYSVYKQRLTLGVTCYQKARW